MLQVPRNERLRTSLAGVDRGLKTLWVDGTAKDFAALQEFQALAQLTIYRLPRRHVSVLAACRLPRLTTLSLRHADADNLQFLGKFATLEALTVWQSRKIKSLDGIERLTRLAEFYINDVGSIDSLAPLEPLTGLRILTLTGGMQTIQSLPPLAPLKALAGLDQLNLTAAKVSDGDLNPLADLKQLTRLELSTRSFEPAEIACVAAAHPFFLRDLLALPDYDAWAGGPGCKKCKSGRKVLFLRSKKLLWCPQCDGAKLKALVAEFEQLVEEKRRERAGGR